MISFFLSQGIDILPHSEKTVPCFDTSSVYDKAMNVDMSELIQLCILDLYGRVRPDYETWRNCIAKNPGDEDPLGWLYLGSAELVIKQRMEESRVEMDLFDDIYFAICWEVRERSLGL